MADVTPAEIKAENFALPSNKSPGFDGYTSKFLKAVWPFIGDEVTDAVLVFFTPGQILKQWNCTAISLIPKKVNVNQISDFIPICLCNVLYKVISKILARRLENSAISDFSIIVCLFKGTVGHRKYSPRFRVGSEIQPERCL